MTAPERYDTIVIGAGMSGLAAGIRLAQYDQRVVVLERHYLWGGLNSFYKRAGRRLDVGLHALTNYAPPGARGLPLTKILRQLRLSHADLKLGQQNYSEVAFPSARLRFRNGGELLAESVAEAFPKERDRFQALLAAVADVDYLSEGAYRGARGVLRELLGDPLLVEMLLCPLCYYGSAREGDIDWAQFCILFRSIFLEGMARPEGGVKRLLDLLVARLREVGGELRMKAGVRQILTRGGRAYGVILDDGTELHAERILSSAGAVETERLCAPDGPAPPREDVGQLSFLEAILVTDRLPAELGHDATIVFFNDADEFDYRRPGGLVDTRSGVFCCPNNYETAAPLAEGCFRLTLMADHAPWFELDEAAYAEAKHEAVERGLDVAARYAVDPRPHEVYRDAFTPRTIRYYTGHRNGAVYGSPRKRFDGRTAFEGLFLCGTDQGYLGVIGALLSGALMANAHGLRAPAEARA